MKRRFLFLVVPVICMAVQFASACPMCKDSIPNAEGASAPTDPSQNPTGGLPGGFNTSVYLMLTGFLFTLGLIGWTLVKGMRTGSGPGGFPIVRKGNGSAAKKSDPSKADNDQSDPPPPADGA